jgi:hypothetical protein
MLNYFGFRPMWNQILRIFLAIKVKYILICSIQDFFEVFKKKQASKKHKNT